LAFNLGEGEHILVVGEELEAGWQVTVVNDVQQAVGVPAQGHLSEVD
jgi:hypothetical protein